MKNYKFLQQWKNVVRLRLYILYVLVGTTEKYHRVLWNFLRCERRISATQPNSSTGHAMGTAAELGISFQSIIFDGSLQVNACKRFKISTSLNFFSHDRTDKENWYGKWADTLRIKEISSEALNTNKKNLYKIWHTCTNQREDCASCDS